MATWYPFSNVTPADPNSLQAIDYTALATGDKAIGEIEAGVVALFKYDTTSSVTEDIPNVVTSDGNAGNGRWIRATFEHINQFFNGTFEESFNALVTSDGATVTMSLAKAGGGDLTCVFSSGFATHAAGSIALTAGTDSAPQINYVYILESDPTTLVKSTTQWPATEHIKVGYFLVPSAAYVQSDGCYINQNWNDHLKDTVGQGHLSHLCEAIRLTMDGAHWHSGVEPNGDGGTFIVTTGTPDEVYFKTTAGVAFQMHRHTIPAIDMQSGDNCHVVNWNGDAYHEIADIAEIIADSTGATLNNKYYNLVFWGTANKTGEYSPLMCNVPSGSYNTLVSAIADTQSYDVTTIPHEFTEDSTIGFLICRLTFKMTGGNTFVLQDTVDLRGVRPGSAGGISAGGGGGITEFPDNVLTIFDSDDITRIMNFDLSSITSGNTRTVTPADAAMTIPSTTEKTGYDSHVAAANPHSGHVDTTGDETIAGKKTFSTFPETPSAAPTTDYQVANKKYVEDYHDANVDLNANDREVYREILEGSAFRKVTWSDCSDLVTFGSFAGATTTDGEKWTFAAADVWTGTSLDESTWATTITKAMLVIDYTGSGTFELSADGGSNWETVTPDKVHTFTNTGTDLRLRITNVSNLVVYSYGVLYDIDDTALALVEYVQSNTGRKNLLINGDMKVSQRGTSFAGLTNGTGTTYTLDRWFWGEDGATDAVLTITQDTDVPTGEGFATSLKVDVTTAEAAVAATEIIYVGQKIEAQDLQHLNYGTSSAKDLTATFWLKSDTKTGSMSLALRPLDGSRYFTSEILVTDNNWNKYTIVVPGDASGIINDDNGAGIACYFIFVVGSTYQKAGDVWGDIRFGTTAQDNFLDHTDNNIWVTGVQLEVGSSATEFEHRTYGEELQLCLRYFEKSYNDSVDPGTVTELGVLLCHAITTTRYFPFLFGVPKRGTPTIVTYSPSTGNTDAWYDYTGAADDTSNIDVYQSSEKRVVFRNTTATADRAYGVHFTADAEL